MERIYRNFSKKEWKKGLICLFLSFSILFFIQTIKEDIQMGNNSLISAVSIKEQNREKTNLVPAKGQGYRLLFADNIVVIYTLNQKQIYEYTDVKREMLPVEIQEKIAKGMIFYSEKELYEFLETYTS